MIFSIYQAAKWAFPTIAWLPVLITAVIAFNPSFIYMSTTIHHDILQATWFALGTWGIMRYTRQRTPYDAFIFGLLVGCAILTKVSGIVLGLGVAVVIIVRAWQAHNWRLFWRDGIISGGIAFLIAGWWFIRNQVLYGDLLGWNAYRIIFHFNLRPEPSQILGFQDFFRQSSRNFWGGFGFRGGTATPTSTWQKTQTWRDAYPLLLPDDLPDGTYTLQIGMYDWPAVERLPIENADQNVLKLGTITIVSE